MTAGTAAAPLLAVRNVTKRFGGLSAIDDVSFDVLPGSITAVIGPNGAGKSTCFNLISGNLLPTSGTIAFEGNDITRVPDYRVARLGIARTFQSTALFRNMSVLDNVVVGARLHAKSTIVDAVLRTPRHAREQRACVDRAHEALVAVNLDRQALRPAGEISQEAQRRVALAIAIVERPKLLLLDEPVAGVTHEEMGEHAELIRTIARSGCTICLVEHKMHLVMGLATAIVVLHHGKKIADGTPQTVAADERVIEAYLGAKSVA